ncbi:hypothetical protein [Micromonospora zhanjiangensis]
MALGSGSGCNSRGSASAGGRCWNNQRSAVASPPAGCGDAGLPVGSGDPVPFGVGAPVPNGVNVWCVPPAVEGAAVVGPGRRVAEGWVAPGGAFGWVPGCAGGAALPGAAAFPEVVAGDGMPVGSVRPGTNSWLPASRWARWTWPSASGVPAGSSASGPNRSGSPSKIRRPSGTAPPIAAMPQPCWAIRRSAASRVGSSPVSRLTFIRVSARMNTSTAGMAVARPKAATSWSFQPSRVAPTPGGAMTTTTGRFSVGDRK